ncbi:hypothetical protein Pogu_2102 [Pyrobaculum oguniense TE7]|uniref:Uncharacterized protein n=1 Tax=Pyrobaculum oguniense (strain DSM 13380 / JCM 10595 / TE7) TaxID=698757 RepID=H6QCT3_PYROT|nr:hypothetical protein Pogu_2102 [Pyrobaculum oguniense TE7]
MKVVKVKIKRDSEVSIPFVIAALSGAAIWLLILASIYAAPPPGCPQVAFAEEQCDEGGCAVAVRITAPSDMFVFIGDTALELKKGENVKTFYVRWGSTLNVATECFKATYEPRRRASNATAGLTD